MKAPRNLCSRTLRFALASTALALALAPAASAQDFYSVIDAAQETPPNGSPATGSATMTLDTVNNALSYNITFSGLLGSETMAHIHGPADPGVAGGIKHTLPLGSPKVGTWFYAEADEADILAGRMYINIHSSMFGGGEIRGQICPTPIEYCHCDVASGPPCGNDDADSGCRNSTGVGANLSITGLPSVILDTLKITATELPLNQNGIFFMGPTQTSATPFGDSLKCVGGQLFRYFPVQNSGGSGTIALGPGIVAKSQTFALAGHIDSGETWNFQAWFRDPMGPCGNAFSVSEAMSVMFTK
jgi:hypothetical protein